MNRASVKSLAVVVLAAALTLAGCGVGVEDAPREVEPPPGRAATIASPTPAATEYGPVAERICLIRDGRLVEVERRVPAVPSVSSLLNDLIAGPTRVESDAGLSSALLGTDVIAGTTVAGGVAKVELVATIGDPGRTDDILALGQIVCTLTARDEIGGVQFTRDGQPVPVPRGDAFLTKGPLTASDYANLLG